MKNISHSIIFSGKISSGKSSVSKLIANRLGASRVSFGSYLKELCLKKNIVVSRENLQELGESLIRSNPKEFLDAVFEPVSNTEIVVIDGLRHKAILDLIRLRSELTTLIFFDLDDELRQTRYQNREKSLDGSKSVEVFQAQNNHIVEREVTDLKILSDLIVDSSLPLNEVIEVIMAFLENSK